MNHIVRIMTLQIKFAHTLKSNLYEIEIIIRMNFFVLNNIMNIRFGKHHEEFIARFKGKISILGKDNDLERVISMGKPIEKTKQRYKDVYNIKQYKAVSIMSRKNLLRVSDNSIIKRKSTANQHHQNKYLEDNVNCGLKREYVLKCLRRFTLDNVRGLHLRLKNGNISQMQHHSSKADLNTILPTIRATSNCPRRNYIKSNTDFSRENKQRKYSRNGLLIGFRSRLN